MLKAVRVPESLAPLFERAEDYVARYFADLDFAPERGTLEISGQRYVLVRAASMSVEFHDVLRSLHGEEEEAFLTAERALFDIAHAMGLADARAFAERMDVSEPIARLSTGPIHFAYAGWAFVDISPESKPSPDAEFHLLYDHPYSFEADAWLNAKRPTSRPVCVMNAGYSAGWCAHSFGMPLSAVEILCRAKGDEACRFIMAPPERLESKVLEYFERRPDLTGRIVNYQVPGFLGMHTDPHLLRKNLELERKARERARELSLLNVQLEEDIAERRKAELALGHSLEIHERLIEALPGGLVQVAKDGAIVRANPAALRILGLDYDALKRRYVRDFEPETLLEDGTPATASDYPVTKALETGLPQPALTMGVRRPNGEMSWAVYRAVPIRDPVTQEVNGALVTFLDITERKRFEDKLRHTQKLESLGVLAGGIAHDFNNLLVTILGNASFARSLIGADPRVAPLLEEIETGARRAADLTKQMLAYAGHGSFKLQKVELPNLVREMATLLKALIPKRVELHYHFQEGLPLLEVDPTQIRQVIMNLVTNAAESLDSQGGRVVITIDQRYVAALELEQHVGDTLTPGSFVSLVVEDTGCGMDEETRTRVFDPFFTTKFQGRGLGMASVVGIIRSHRGSIRIESQPGCGTRVTVLLPINGSEPKRAASAPGLRLGTVLVVDDDAGVRSLVRRILSERGYRVISATNGVEGCRMLEQHAKEVDMVLMDMMMPEMGGLEALKHIREAGSKVPVLLSSGYDLEFSAAELGICDGLLAKPYDVAELISAVERAIARGH